MLNNHGVLSCVDTKTGELVWHRRVDGEYFASLLYADIFGYSQGGKTVLFNPGD